MQEQNNNNSMTQNNQFSAITDPHFNAVQVNISTWVRDSHGLYDYEAPPQKYINTKIELKKSFKLFENIASNKTFFLDIDHQRQLPSQYIFIASVIIDVKTQNFIIKPALTDSTQQSQLSLAQPNILSELPTNSYLVVKSYQQQQNAEQGYPLHIGDIIKLGRIQYIIQQIKTQQKVQTCNHTSFLQLNTSNYIVDRQLTGICKISLNQQSTIDDPLISPCLCRGSCQLVHVSCLKLWMRTKIKKEVMGIVNSYNFSKFQCQICKTPSPRTVTLMNGQVVNMIQIDKPDKPYIILQAISQNTAKKQRNLHIISPDTLLNSPQNAKSIKIGRGHNCHIKINDVSVSRVHSQISYHDNNFYIKDVKSKFGTLVLFNQEINININTNIKDKDKDKDKGGIMLQCGRTTYRFDLVNCGKDKMADVDDTLK